MFIGVHWSPLLIYSTAIEDFMLGICLFFKIYKIDAVVDLKKDLLFFLYGRTGAGQRLLVFLISYL